MRLTAVLLVACLALAVLPRPAVADATPAEAPAPTPAPPPRYTPPGWPDYLSLALADNGQVRRPGDPDWDPADKADFVWEIPGAAAGDSIMLFRISGRHLPAATPDPATLSDQQVADLLTGIAQDNAHGLTVKLEDGARLVPLGDRPWARVQVSYGDPMLNRNGIIYLTYTPQGYFALAAEYHFVIEAGLLDAASTTAGDAEEAFQQVLRQPAP
jgi:hypothetical protein